MHLSHGRQSHLLGKKESKNNSACNFKLFLLLKELFINFVGGILFILTGTFTFVEARKGYKNDAEMALGILCIIAGVIFLVDFIVSFRNSRVTVVRTTRTVV